jgi:hypothetical protein
MEEENNEVIEVKKQKWYQKKVIGIPMALLIIGLVVIGGASAYAGYRLLTARSHFTVAEAFEVEYFETSDQQWHSLPVNGATLDLGLATIMPGETSTFYVRVRNIATSGTLGAELLVDGTSGLSHSLVCNGPNGVQWDVNGNTYYVKVPSGGAWQEVGIGTSASGDAQPATGIIFDNVLTRNNALGSYSNTCS